MEIVFLQKRKFNDSVCDGIYDEVNLSMFSIQL